MADTSRIGKVSSLSSLTNIIPSMLSAKKFLKEPFLDGPTAGSPEISSGEDPKVSNSIACGCSTSIFSTIQRLTQTHLTQRIHRFRSRHGSSLVGSQRLHLRTSWWRYLQKQCKSLWIDGRHSHSHNRSPSQLFLRSFCWYPVRRSKDQLRIKISTKRHGMENQKYRWIEKKKVAKRRWRVWVE